MRQGLVLGARRQREAAMTDDVSAWRQSGTLYVWRYAAPGRSRRGWHFSADPSGCASVVDLIARMTTAAVACRRTLSLGHVSADIWGVPNFGPPQADRFEKLRIAYLPAASDLSLVDDDGRLDLTFGGTRAGGPEGSVCRCWHRRRRFWHRHVRQEKRGNVDVLVDAVHQLS